MGERLLVRGVYYYPIVNHHWRPPVPAIRIDSAL